MNRGRDLDDPTIVAVLLGRHSYGMTPELETAWCRVCLVFGVLLGLGIALWR